MVIDRVASDLGAGAGRKKFASEYCEAGDGIFLVKPAVFMNGSGLPVISWVNYLKAGHGDLLVICDDFSLELGKLRFRKSGSGGGHNGLKSIIEHLGTTEFPRLRIGIGRPPGVSGREENGEPPEMASWVLEDFSKKEMETVDRAVEVSSKAVLEFIENGIDFVMNVYNGGPKE